MKSNKFIDTVTVQVFAGDGGNGCASFRREKYIPKGGPDGGDGGHGGSVVFRADTDVSSLISLYYAPHQRAGKGGHGKGKQLHGKNGQDKVINIPCGTEVWDEQNGVMLADIISPGETFIAARGGKGGLGNCHWKTSTHQTPTEHTDGEPGEEKKILLKLKLISDVGLVGYPNAGKSSLLRAVSDAHPKVAAYPFTTLNPIIGTVIFNDHSRLTVADIPGLIDGAHRGVGLGHAFLRHIERARYLVFVVDMAGVDMRKPHEDYVNLRKEIELYRKDLLEKECLVVANKMDLPEAKENIDIFVKETGINPLRISAKTLDGIDEIRKILEKTCRDESE